MANFKSDVDVDDSSGNHFVNDGSFMEMFKRLQEQQTQSANENSPVEVKEDSPSTSNSARTANQKPEPQGRGAQKAPEARVDKKKEKEEGMKTDYPPLAKASQGVMLGKRKSLMKSIELREKRKRHREEMEEQQLAQQQQKDKDKSSAWKAYMAQVKAYEARSCTDDDDGHRRPLVK